MNPRNTPIPRPKIFAALTFAALLSQGAANPATADFTLEPRPQGALSISATALRSGIKPLLRWNIVHPATLSGQIEIIPPASIRVPFNTYVTVRMVGTRVKKTTILPDGGVSTTALPTEASFSLNRSPFTRIFFGTQSQVKPHQVLFWKRVKAGDIVDLGGRFLDNSQWSPSVNTLNSSLPIAIVADGQTPPHPFNANADFKVHNFLKNYFRGNKAWIGPGNLLVFMELNETDRMAREFDLQDQVLHVSFTFSE